MNDIEETQAACARAARDERRNARSTREKNRIVDWVARARGIQAEERVLKLCRSNARPAWMKTARYATRQEDHAGIDIVLETDVGRLYLQVKSSYRGVQEFLATPGKEGERRRRARIAVVVVRPEDLESGVMRRVVIAVGNVRDTYLSVRTQGRAGGPVRNSV